MNEAVDVVVVGAGQAGLAAGACLSMAGLTVLLLEGSERVGDVWRNRWDSLQLFTPSRYNHLPGLPFPAGDTDHLPSKDEVGDYLEAYAAHHKLDVRLQTRVTGVRPDGAGYLVTHTSGEVRADHVVVATGAFQIPKRPPFARELDAGIQQLDGAEYRNPDQVAAGDVLVVGAGNSGMQIGMDLARTGRKVYVAGRDTGRIPRRFLGVDIYRWLVGLGVTTAHVDSWLGSRIVAKAGPGGDPLVGISAQDISESGLERTGRVASVTDALPVLDDGRKLNVDAVIWCCGFHPDFSWIEGLPTDADGAPIHTLGAVDALPGVHFMGLRMMARINSSLLGGVGADAQDLTARITQGRALSDRTQTPARSAA